jgi:DNA-binding transcriptional MerR regulator
MRVTGITYRQLDYWARTGLVPPSIADAHGSGSKRRYSFTDVVHIKVIKNLLDAGVTLPKIRKAIDFIRHELNVPLEQVVLASNGSTVFARTSATEALDLLNGGQAVFLIAMDQVYEQMQGTIADFKRPTQEAEPAGTASRAHGG